MNQDHMEQPIIKDEASDVGMDPMARMYNDSTCATATQDGSVQVTDPVSPDDEDDDSCTDLKRAADEDNLLANGAGLPPRKRAKTKDEKEQRRIERIMRNRQAAHASREKKRRYLEELEQKCESLSRSNVDLESQLQRAQRLQVESQERHLALQTRLQQVESALQMAKSSGDVSVLENLAAVQTPEEPKPNSTECTSPGNLQLLSIPSLSNSAGNSPAQADDSDDFEPLDPFSAFPADISSLDSSSKTHHPAAMV